MKTLYITDLDGTLLNRNGEVSEYTVDVLNRCIDNGMLFSVATARTPATVMKKLEQIRLRLPLVLMTGAVLFHPEKDEYIYTSAFKADELDKLLTTFREYGVNPLAHQIKNQHITVYHGNLNSTFEERFIDDRTGTKYKDYRIVDNYEEALFDGKVALFLCMDKMDKLRPLARKLQADENVLTNSYCYPESAYPGYGYLEVFPKETSKAVGIGQLANALSVTEIISFGDNVNDVSMFEISTKACAVQNASNEIKQYADEIIGHHDKDGVARFIEHHYYR